MFIGIGTTGITGITNNDDDNDDDDDENNNNYNDDNNYINYKNNLGLLLHQIRVTIWIILLAIIWNNDN